MNFHVLPTGSIIPCDEQPIRDPAMDLGVSSDRYPPPHRVLRVEAPKPKVGVRALPSLSRTIIGVVRPSHHSRTPDLLRAIQTITASRRHKGNRRCVCLWPLHVHPTQSVYLAYICEVMRSVRISSASYLQHPPRTLRTAAGIRKSAQLTWRPRA